MGEPAGFEGAIADSRFERLYRTYYREILAYFLRRIPAADAEDATSEVFMVAWRRLDQVPTDGGAVAWLFGVAHNMLSNHRRGWRRAKRLTRRLGGLAEPVAESPEVQVVRSTEDEAVLRAIERIRPADAEILRLALWEKLPHRDIGSTLGISEAAVSQRISRARRRLAKALRRHGYGSSTFRLSVGRKEGGAT